MALVMQYGKRDPISRAVSQPVEARSRCESTPLIGQKILLHQAGERLSHTGLSHTVMTLLAPDTRPSVRMSEGSPLIAACTNAPPPHRAERGARQAFELACRVFDSAC